MRCGKCKGDHPAVEDVRTCYGMDDPTPVWPASEAQINYVLGLQDERLLPEDYKVKTTYDLQVMERDEVSGIINLLKTFRRKESGTARKQWTMPAGRYALRDDDGEWWFFEVTKGKERWKGYTFIKRLVGAPGDYRKVEVPRILRDSMLRRIEADPEQAMTDYGLRSGVCGKCHSPLTNPESLARGIGPICLGKLGW